MLVTAARPVAAVLAGGASRRFGRDKAAEPIDGTASLQRVVAAAAAVLPVVLVVGGDGPLPAKAQRRVPDLEPGGGPVQAAVAAFRAAPDQGVLLLACDLPRLTPSVVAWLAQPLVAGIDARVPQLDGRRQPLAALYAPTAAAAFEAAHAAGERALHHVLARLTLEDAQPPEPDALRDFDTPADLADLNP